MKLWIPRSAGCLKLSVSHSLMMSLKGRSNLVKLCFNSVAHLLYRYMGENGV